LRSFFAIRASASIFAELGYGIFAVVAEQGRQDSQDANKAEQAGHTFGLEAE